MAHNVFGKAMPSEMNTEISVRAMPSSPTALCWTMEAPDAKTQGLQRRFHEGGFHVPEDEAILMQLAREFELNQIVATVDAYWRRIDEIFDQARRLFGEDGIRRLAARIPGLDWIVAG